ncbi:MAG: ATP-dependent Clp protease ATP-binding subunit [Lachnospiraceae bacterium]
MNSEFTEQAKRAILYAEKTAKNFDAGYVGTEHLLAGLIREGSGVAAMVLRENHVDETRLIDLISEAINPSGGTILKERRGFSMRAENAMEQSHVLAKKYSHEKAGTEHLLLAILKDSRCVAVRLLRAMGIDEGKLVYQIFCAMGMESIAKQERDELRYANKRAGMPGKEKSVLKQFGCDLNEMAKNNMLDPVIGRKDEIKRVIQILSRRMKNNPCLVGDPGVGKTAIAEGIAIAIVKGDVPDTIKNKRVVTLDLPGMLAGTKYRGEFEERIKNVMQEVETDGNVILFLDEIHTLIGAGSSEGGSIDASNMLKPALSRGAIQVIGATTLNEYRKYFERDAALERRFQPITVAEPTVEQAIEILSGIAHKYEEHHGIRFLPEAIEAAVRMSDRYINDRYLPDKAIDLLDEAAAAAKLKGMIQPQSIKELQEKISQKDDQIERSIKIEAFLQAGELKREQKLLRKKLERMEKAYEKKLQTKDLVVDEKAIAETVSIWTKVPVKQLTEKESERLLKLEDNLHKRVIGQDEAVTAVAKAIRRGRVGLQDPKKPIGSFLFLGPTGVGKTELSKALAQLVFGSEKAIIRVDMSEFMESHSVSKLIGAPPGYVGHDDGGQLSDKVRQNPYSVILLDEVEKAHPDVFNVFLQILDDGHITDSKGRRVNFKNTVLIMTSNAGAQNIIAPKNLGFVSKSDAEQDYKKMKDSVMEEVKRIFKPEFINRIDEMIVFHTLTKDDLRKIMNILCKEFSDRAMSQMNLKITVSKQVKEHLIENFADYKMGARPLKRAIQTQIEDGLAEELLSGKIVPGDQVTVSLKNGKIVFLKKEKQTKKENA